LFWSFQSNATPALNVTSGARIFDFGLPAERVFSGLVQVLQISDPGSEN
jgi:hypothetical protein